MKKDKIVYLDYLRFFAIIAVIVIHVAAQNIYQSSAQSFEWHVFNVYDSVVRWGVPIFIMISGALFLSKEIEIKTLYKKYIARLAISYCVWSIFYAIAIPVCDYVVENDLSALYASIADRLVNSTYHLWFLPMIIGLYMCVPFLRQIVRQKSVSRYFLILSFIFAFIIPQTINLATHFAGETMNGVLATVNNILSDMKMDIVMGYAFYFVFGYELHNAELTKKQRAIIYVLGAVGFLSTIVLTALASQKAQTFAAAYYEYLSVNVALEAIAVCTWFKYGQYKNKKVTVVISKFAQHSFGAYLIHVLVLKVLQVMGLTTTTFSALLSVPSIFFVVFVVSFAFAFVFDGIRGKTRKGVGTKPPKYNL